jgi:hypothetical protein
MAKPGNGPGRELAVNVNQKNKRNVSGQKRKQLVYQPKAPITPVLLLEGPTVGQSSGVSIHPAADGTLDGEHDAAASDNNVDSNKKMRKGSADQAGAVEQPR